MLLVLTVAVFSTAVLWLHWRLLLEQFDERPRVDRRDRRQRRSKRTRGGAGSRLVAARNGGRRAPIGLRREVLDASGAPVRKRAAAVALARRTSGCRVHESHTDDRRGGRRAWRVTVQARAVAGRPLLRRGRHAARGGDRAMADAVARRCLIGIPLALAVRGRWRTVARTARAAAADLDGGGGAGDYGHDAGQRG